MKVVVFSDVHGYLEWAKTILEHNPDADYIISLGDSEVDPQFLLDHDIVHVRGNSHRDPGFVDETSLQVEGIHIFITHGHTYKVHRSLDKLIKHGLENNYQLVLYGHTHVLKKEKYGPMYVVNPGSVYSPRSAFPPSYLIVDIQGDEMTFTFKEVQSDRVLEV